MISLDFAPGAHGHFLEYVINRYIFDMPEIKNIFQSSGAADRLSTFDDYRTNKAVNCGHYSSFGLPMTESTEKIIFIRHTPALDIILLTNIYYRCHAVASRSYDYDVEKIMEYHRTLMLESQEDWQLKNNWYTKLTERHFDQTLAYNNPRNLPTFNFNFECFFDFTKFVSVLQEVSQFVNMTLRYDSSLYDLWLEFMNRNQGYDLYTQGNRILSFAYGNQPHEIPNNWQLHAYLNYVLSASFRIHDGILHTNKIYPTDTCELYSIIQKHLAEFDLNW